MSDNLPKDVMQAILVRLPAKELVKCQLVCKSWYSLIKSPTFISTHLLLQLQLARARARAIDDDNDPLLIRLKPLFNTSCCCPVKEEEEGHYTLHFANRVAAQHEQVYRNANRHTYRHRLVSQPQPHRQFQVHFPCTTKNARIVGYCNGLLCFSPSPTPSTSRRSFVVWNPSLRKFFTIPPNSHTSTTTTTQHSDSFNGVGFGFDSTTNDFKLLVGLDLYSLSSNSWKTIAATAPPDFRVSDDASDVFVKGALHFLGNITGNGSKANKKKLMLGFDVGNETFREITLPSGLNTADDRSLKIGKFGEYIALSASVSRYYHVWVMNGSFWTKILDMADDMGFPPRMLGVWNNGGEILMVRYGDVFSTDLKTGEADYGGWSSRMYASVDTFVDSLVLLDVGEDMSHYIDDVNETNDDDAKDAS